MADLKIRFPVYSRLLKLYPAPYRERYGEQMLQTLADMLDASSSVSGRSAVWVQVSFDLPGSIARQQLSFVGNVFTRETPAFVRRNSVISTILLAPFFVIAITNDIDAHRLYNTWLWSAGVLFTWIVLLPVLGMALSATTLFFWLRTNKRSWRQSLLDLAHNWMILLPIVLGLGILFLVFFHDSVHCVAGSPVRELRGAHATLHCIASNAS
jgi:hypothetical protein